MSHATAFSFKGSLATGSHSIVSPLAEDQCIVVVEPNTEDHEEDALDDLIH